MKIATGFSTDEDAIQACRAAYSQIAEHIDGAPDLIYAAWSVVYDAEQILAELRRLAPDAKLHSASTCLGGMTQEGFVSEGGRGLTLLAMSDPAGAYGVGGAEINASAREAATEAILAALEDADRPGEIPTMVRLSASPGAEEAVIAGIEDVLGQGV
ncbi:MAG: hypothetical protein HQL47_08080, partial [Gammaproteobacteria bacterium]|nr:hypothetical protein [Gammaproteobacteria bacterium]